MFMGLVRRKTTIIARFLFPSHYFYCCCCCCCRWYASLYFRRHYENYYYYYRDIEAVLNASCIISNHTFWDDEETMASFIDCNETSCSDLVWMVYMQREWLLWKHFRLCALNLALEVNLFWILVAFKWGWIIWFKWEWVYWIFVIEHE